jgi:hypothetical protein
MRNLGLSKKICLVIILFYSFFPHSNAQNEVNIDLGANFVSSYVWRGIKQTGFSVQPSLGANYRGLHLSSWASTDISNGNDRGFKEVDFTLGYSKNGFNIALIDYWWDGEGAHRYFSGAREGYSGHMLEGTIGYTLPERFPLSINWNTFFLGKGNKKEDGSNSYSTYIELAYPFSVNDIDMGLALGFTPWKSVVYGPDANGFKVTNIMLSASYSIKFSDSFSLPIYGNIIFNPATEDTHFVFGITLSK